MRMPVKSARNIRFLKQVSKSFFFFFFLSNSHPACQNVTFGKVCKEDLFVTASNYSGTERTGEGLGQKMAPVYLNVTSAR